MLVTAVVGLLASAAAKGPVPLYTGQLLQRLHLLKSLAGYGPFPQGVSCPEEESPIVGSGDCHWFLRQRGDLWCHAIAFQTTGL